ncbi:MAG: PDZ domain-containing protein, partial [Lachnospiraceae bacterium]|nr:PDZ domain-containing protein [Lachnospiraceae bacterium]
MKIRIIFKKLIFIFMLSGIIMIPCGWLYFTWEKIPSSIRIKEGEQIISLDVPVKGEVYLENSDAQENVIAAAEMEVQQVMSNETIQLDLSRPLTVKTNQVQNYKMDVKLFGVIPFKTVDVQVVPKQTLIPAGVPIGIYIKTDGIMVIGESDFEGMDHSKKEPARHLLQEGDYILKVDGQKVGSKKNFIAQISESEGKEMILTIRREEETFDVKVKPEQNVDGEYKLGIWIRDNAQGVGTMTFLTADNGFGALGHGI